MLLVILGAGASYDSAPSKPPTSGDFIRLPNRPPLAKELFGDRQYFGQVMGKYQRCIDIAPRLRHLQDGVSIESLLQNLQTETKEYPDRFQQLASVRYYLQDILSTCANNWIHECQHVLNHRTLIDDIKRFHKKGDQVCFVTFNYDTLIDYALATAGYSFANMNDYIARDFLLIKLHGSVDWGRIVDTPLSPEILRDRDSMARELISKFGTIAISQRYVKSDGFPPSTSGAFGIFPALAIPVETKLEFECSESHVEALKTFISQVTRIIIIGWRATEQPFLQMLRAGLKDKAPYIVIANGTMEDSESAANNIRRIGFAANYWVLPDGFTEFILKNRASQFLTHEG